MDASYGERKIHEILEKADLNYKMEYVFPELRSSNGRPLRFDFVVFDDDGNIDFLIEMQGIQHYVAKDKFGGIPGLRKQQYNDMLKKEYCQRNGYNLVIIPYWEENLINYDYIMQKAGY